MTRWFILQCWANWHDTARAGELLERRWVCKYCCLTMFNLANTLMCVYCTMVKTEQKTYPKKCIYMAIKNIVIFSVHSKFEKLTLQKFWNSVYNNKPALVVEIIRIQTITIVSIINILSPSATHPIFVVSRNTWKHHLNETDLLAQHQVVQINGIHSHNREKAPVRGQFPFPLRQPPNCRAAKRTGY